MALPALVFLALAAFAAALLWSPYAGRAAVLHLMLAVGAMPLIFGAMTHFIPVLTRTRSAPAGLLGVPLLGLAGGALVVGSLGFPHMIWGRHARACAPLRWWAARSPSVSSFRFSSSRARDRSICPCLRGSCACVRALPRSRSCFSTT